MKAFVTPQLLQSCVEDGGKLLCRQHKKAPPLCSQGRCLGMTCYRKHKRGETARAAPELCVCKQRVKFPRLSLDASLNREDFPYGTPFVLQQTSTLRVALPMDGSQSKKHTQQRISKPLKCNAARCFPNVAHASFHFLLHARFCHRNYAH